MTFHISNQIGKVLFYFDIFLHLFTIRKSLKYRFLLEGYIFIF